MAVTIKKAVLWRKEVDNYPGALADTLEPLAHAGADLKLVMGYRFPGNESRAAVEVYPISGKKAAAAAQQTGLAASPIPTLIIEGDDKPGLGHAISRALGDAGVNLAFAMTQVIGRKYTAVMGFENDADATRAAGLIKKAAPPKKK